MNTTGFGWVFNREWLIDSRRPGERYPIDAVQALSDQARWGRTYVTANFPMRMINCPMRMIDKRSIAMLAGLLTC